MLNFLQLNGGTILLTAVLVLAVVSIIRYLVRQKRQGCSSCGCGCSSCPLSSSCHTTPPTH